MQKSLPKKRLNDLKRKVCWAIYQRTKSWSNRLWRIALALFLVAGCAGSLWHIGAGLFSKGKTEPLEMMKEKIMVPPHHFPDSSSLGIPLDSLIRGAEGSPKIEP